MSSQGNNDTENLPNATLSTSFFFFLSYQQNPTFKIPFIYPQSTNSRDMKHCHFQCSINEVKYKKKIHNINSVITMNQVKIFLTIDLFLFLSFFGIKNKKHLMGSFVKEYTSTLTSDTTKCIITMSCQTKIIIIKLLFD